MYVHALAKGADMKFVVLSLMIICFAGCAGHKPVEQPGFGWGYPAAVDYNNIVQG